MPAKKEAYNFIQLYIDYNIQNIFSEIEEIKRL